MKRKNYEVLLIIGYGHSGTTILDTVLGSAEGAFSCGELTYITRNQFFDEYCSCGSVIRECSFWGPVFEKWMAGTTGGVVSSSTSVPSASSNPRVPMTMEEYRLLRNRFERNKAYLRSLFRYVSRNLFRDDAYSRYVEATERLYDIIAAESGSKVIVDSSKMASRAFLLASFCRFRVVHVCRNFRGVLNSERKDVKVDLKAGIEAASKPKRAKKVLIDWFVSNVACSLSRIWFGGRMLHFRQWIRMPELLRVVQPALQPGFEKGLFKAEHMVAGNAIRMKPPQKLRIVPNGGARSGTSQRYERLERRHQVLGRFVEKLLPFWNR